MSNTTSLTTSNTLFAPYVNTFFEMKKKAEEEKNPGMKQVAKLCLNSFYGKFGFNIENQDAHHDDPEPEHNSGLLSTVSTNVAP
jgi:hypothetical protein